MSGEILISLALVPCVMMATSYPLLDSSEAPLETKPPNAD